MEDDRSNLAEGVTREYLVRMSREYTLLVHAASEADADRIAAHTPFGDWDDGGLSAQEVEEA